MPSDRDERFRDTRNVIRCCSIHPTGCSPYCINWYNISVEGADSSTDSTIVATGTAFNATTDLIDNATANSSRRNSASSAGSSNSGSGVSSVSSVVPTPTVHAPSSDDIGEVAISVDSAQLSPIMNLLKLKESDHAQQNASAFAQLNANAGSIVDIIFHTSGEELEEEKKEVAEHSTLSSVFNSKNSLDGIGSSVELFEMDL